MWSSHAGLLSPQRSQRNQSIMPFPLFIVSKNGICLVELLKFIRPGLSESIIGTFVGVFGESKFSKCFLDFYRLGNLVDTEDLVRVE
jgi:hypothetical protein